MRLLPLKKLNGYFSPWTLGLRSIYLLPWMNVSLIRYRDNKKWIDDNKNKLLMTMYKILTILQKKKERNGIRYHNSDNIKSYR